jgi:membrane dipeptidase
MLNQFWFFNTESQINCGEIQWVELFYKLGVRIVQLAHNWRNMVADGCGESPRVRATRSGSTRTGSDVGLSEYGEEVVNEMNRLGMIVDVSHVGDRSSMEAIERGKVVVASHANARKVCDNRSNKTDECLKAITAKDGVVRMNALNRARRRREVEDEL